MADLALTGLRLQLSERLLERRPEFEAAVQTRAHAVSDPAQTGDPAYVEGLRSAFSASFDYAISALEADGGDLTQVPPALLVQARLAARNGVTLDTVLRRYFAGYTLFGDFMMQEAEAGAYPPVAMQRLTRVQANLFDRLITAVTEEHTNEWERRSGSGGRSRLERVEALLDGELGDGEGLEYDFERLHVGVIAVGAGATEAVRALATSLDARLLLAQRDEETTWAWLGIARESDPEPIFRTAARATPATLQIALGEPALGLLGWRLTHRQAMAAASIAARTGAGATRYGDVALLAATLRDSVFAASLRMHFLAPLAAGRDRGTALLATLRSYFELDRNVSSAAAALGVSRQTAINRLRVAEERLGRRLGDCAPELEAALRLHQYERTGAADGDRAAAPAPVRLQADKLATRKLDKLPTRGSASA